MSANRFWAAAILSALLFGAYTPISKYFLINTHPFALAGFYYLGAALFLLPLSFGEFRREFLFIRKNRQDFLKLSGAIFFGGMAGPVVLFIGLRISPASSAALLLNFEGLWTFVLGWLFFKEHINRKIIFSMLAVLLGGSLLVIEKDMSFNFGGILIVFACLFWGLDNNLTATIEGVSATTNTILKSFFAGILNLAIYYFFIAKNQVSVAKGVELFYILLVGGLSYGLSIVLYIRASKFLGAIRSQMIFALNPFWGAILSFLVLQEKLSLNFVISSLFMALALGLLFFERHIHEHGHHEEEHEHLHSHDDGHHHHEHIDEKGDKLVDKTTHIHRHNHAALMHSHPHFPDIHHRHGHGGGRGA